MDTYIQGEKEVNEFVRVLSLSNQIIAPVKSDPVSFKPIKDPKEIYLDKQPYFPAKEYFFKQEQVLFSFEGTNMLEAVPKAPKRVFFGLRRCDLNAIYHQDIVFLQDASDPYYKAMRKESILIGYHCNSTPSKYCFCGSLNLKEFFDLMYYDRGDHFIVEVGSEKGKELISAHSTLFKKSPRKVTQSEKIIPGADRLETLEIKELYENPEWKKGVDLCLSCTACTALCPTCYCFEIKDEVKKVKPLSGERKRTWSSCQVPEFTRIAGDHVFRKEREQRFKHRIYHQLDYFKEKYNVNLCVGCGRCIEGCPTRIDFVQIINDMPKGGK